MSRFYCNNCSYLLNGNEEFCPECEVPVIENDSGIEEYYICPVCEAKNPPGERKCNHCCSIL